MKTIRKTVFETNSSSIHSLTMCSADEYSKFENGEMLYDSNHDSLTTLHDVYNKITATDKFSNLSYTAFKDAIKYYFDNYTEQNNDIEEDEDIENENIVASNTRSICSWLLDYSYYTIHNFVPAYMESYDESYTSKSGDKIVAFGYYGHD